MAAEITILKRFEKPAIGWRRALYDHVIDRFHNVSRTDQSLDKKGAPLPAMRRLSQAGVRKDSQRDPLETYEKR